MTEAKDLVVVEFVKGHGIYAKGDVAGFSEKEAEALLKEDKNGESIAVEFKGEKKSENKAVKADKNK